MNQEFIVHSYIPQQLKHDLREGKKPTTTNMLHSSIDMSKYCTGKITRT